MDEYDEWEPDTDGNLPTFYPGDWVYILPLKINGSVDHQVLHHDLCITFWGNVNVILEDGEKIYCNSWQLEMVRELKR